MSTNSTEQIYQLEGIKSLMSRLLVIENIVLGKEKGDLSRIKPPISPKEWQAITDYVMRNQEDNITTPDMNTPKLLAMRRASELKALLYKAYKVELQILSEINNS